MIKQVAADVGRSTMVLASNGDATSEVKTMYIVLFNDYRTLEVPCGEARFWAWVAMEYATCGVYDLRGNGLPLSPFDIY